MSKVIKKIANLLLHTLSGVVLVAILLILGVALAFSLPRVQTFAAQEATKWLQERSGVTITVGAISLEHITYLTAKDLYVEDLKGDTLLWARHASGLIDRNALLNEGRFIPSNVKVKDAKFYLMTYADRSNNVDLLVRHFENLFPTDTTKAGSTFAIKNASAENLRFRLYDERLAGLTPPTAIDYSDMDIVVKSADFGEIKIIGPDILLSDIDNFTAIDKSGAELHDSSIGSLFVAEGLLDFREIDFLSGESHLQLPFLTLSSPVWEDYSKFNDRVTLNLQVKNSTIFPDDAGKWVAELGYYGLLGNGIDGLFKGKVNDFVTNVTGSFYDTDVVAAAEVKDITRPDRMTANVDLDFAATPDKVRAIYRGVLGTEMPEEIDEWVSKFDTLSLGGQAQLVPNKVTTDMHLATDLGNVTVCGTVGFGSEGGSFDGDIRSEGVDVGKLLAIGELGKANFTVDGNVSLVGGKPQGEVDARIGKLNLKGYDFEDIALQASLTDSLLKATAISKDKNALLFAEGEGDLRGEEPEYNLLLILERVDFGAMGFTKDESTSWLSGNVEASLTGRTLDDMTGRAMINDLVYASAADTLSTELVNISLAGGAESKSFSLYSPIVDVEYRSSAPYKSVVDYLTKTLPSQLPLAKNTSSAPSSSEEQSLGAMLYSANDYTAVALSIKEGEALAAVLYPTANIAPDSSVSVEFSPAAQEFSLIAESAYFAVEDVMVSELSISAGGAGSTLNLSAECDELLVGALSVPDVSIQAGAGEGGAVSASLYFSNVDSALSGRLSVDGKLTRNEKDYVLATASILDSYIISPSHRWDITAKEIGYNSESMTIDGFSAECENGGIYINGEVAESSRTPLNLSLKNVSLGEWVSLLTDLKSLEGRIDGDVTLYSALRSPFGEATLSLSGLSAEGVKIDPVALDVEIPRRSTTAEISLRNTILNTTLASATYDYRKGDYKAAVTAEGLDLSLLNPLFAGIASGVGGTGNIDLDLSGKKNTLNIDGAVTINNLTAKLELTGASYSADRLTIKFDDNRGLLSPVQLTDGAGGWADVEGYVDLQRLSDVGFGISLIPHNLTVIDLPAGEENPFYGKVYASGGVRLTSQSGKTDISGAVTTGAGSVFNLPLTGNTDFAGADFVTFVDRSAMVQSSTSAQMLARRKSELRKKTRAALVGGTSLDVMLNVGTNTLLRIIIDPATDNVIEARGTADLGITFDERKNEFAIRGDYEISEGVYNFNFQNLITKQFIINPDSYIRWNGNPLDANINVGATYKLKTSLAPLLGGDSSASRASTPVECIVDLTGSLSRVNVSFDINVPNANTEYQSILSSYFSSQEMMATQFVYLLALGNFYSDSTTEQTNTPGAASSAIGLDFLASQVSKLVSNEAYKFNLKYKAIDDTSSSYSLDFETEIIDDRLLLELEANVDTGDYYKLGNENGNQLSGGGAITLLLDNSGDFYLKGFSRTIDRFDENQGLQENGVGLYYKRSFNRLSDLWRKKKEKAREDSEKSDTFVTTEKTQPKEEK